MTHYHVYGYASVFDIIDAQEDRIQRGAFTRSLEHAQRTKRYPHMFYQHDPGQCIGTWTYMHEDTHGLWVEGVLSKPPFFIHDQSIMGLSIGYDSVRSRKRAVSLRDVQDVDLFEVSLVRQPANPLTYACFQKITPHTYNI